MSNKTVHHKKAMLEALHQCSGNVSDACAIAKVGRTTHYDWLRDDPEYKQQVEDIAESEIDFAESKLRERMNGVLTTKDGKTFYTMPPDPACIIFYLKTKGQKRGYIEKQQIDHGGGITINGEVKVINTGSGIATSESNVDV